MKSKDAINMSKQGLKPYEDCFDEESKQAITDYMNSLSKWKVLTLMANPKKFTNKLMELVTKDTRNKIEKRMRKNAK